MRQTADGDQTAEGSLVGVWFYFEGGGGILKQLGC